MPEQRGGDGGRVKEGGVGKEDLGRDGEIQ